METKGALVNSLPLLESPPHPATSGARYRPLTLRALRKSRYWQLIPPDLREGLEVVSLVLPFRINEYVLQELIDWERVPEDPIYQMTFLQRQMLDEEDFSRLAELRRRDVDRQEIDAEVHRIRLELNPHPAGQLTDNVPTLAGRRLTGLQHKYQESVLFFPAAGQVCHAYCTYCFRWAQFVDLPQMRFQARDAEDLVTYLRSHPEVTDVIFTGGDPMIMGTAVLRRYIEPLLDDSLEHVQTIRIGTKSPAYWPQRFVTDGDADALLRLFEEVTESGRHLALMAHYSHPVELAPTIARQAVGRIRSTGAEIRMQAPLMRRVNDRAEDWAELWRTGVRLGMVPYYLFVERDTGPRDYFSVPLARAYEVFRDAYAAVSGIARTVRGPSMSAYPGKVRVLGVTTIGDERCFVLDLLQVRDPQWVRRPFFARFDPEATWFDQLEPAAANAGFFPDSGPPTSSRRVDRPQVISAAVRANAPIRPHHVRGGRRSAGLRVGRPLQAYPGAGPQRSLK
jgi:KamA family protein